MKWLPIYTAVLTAQSMNTCADSHDITLTQFYIALGVMVVIAVVAYWAIERFFD